MFKIHHKLMVCKLTSVCYLLMLTTIDTCRHLVCQLVSDDTNGLQICCRVAVACCNYSVEIISIKDE